MFKRVISLFLVLFLFSACNTLSADSPANNDDEVNNSGVIVAVYSEEQDGGASDPRKDVFAGGGDDQNSENDSDDAQPAGEGASLIFYNGPILTMDDAQPVVEAVAIQGNLIVAVGDQDMVFAFQTDETRMLDLQGKTLMPGFIDGHSHMFTQYDGLGGSIEAVQEQVLAEGITTMADMGGDRGEVLSQLQEMEASGTLRMRVSMYLNQVNVCGEDYGYWYQDFSQSLEPDALVQVPGVKIFLDGGNCNKIARTVGDPGDLYFTEAQAVQIIEEINGRGFQVAAHALGDRAIDQALAVMAQVNQDGSNPMRNRIEHNASVRPDQMALYSESKPVAMVFGGSASCWWNGMSSEFSQSPAGESLLWEWPTHDLMEANPEVVFAWHEDVPVFPLGAVEQLWGFVTRKQIMADGSICDPPDFAAAQTIPVETALEVMTINAAYALLRENEVGSLEVGKLADMIVLSENPLEMNPDDLLKLEVQATIVNGQTQFCAEGTEDFCP